MKPSRTGSEPSGGVKLAEFLDCLISDEHQERLHTVEVVRKLPCLVAESQTVHSDAAQPCMRAAYSEGDIDLSGY